MSRTLKQIVEEMEVCQQRMETLHGKAKDETDTTKKAELVSQIKAKTAEFADLRTELSDAKTAFENAKALEDAKALIATDVQGKNLNPGPLPTPGVSASVDPATDAHLRRGFFQSYLKHGAKALSGEQFAALQPKDGRFTNAMGDQSVCVPMEMTNVILGKVVASTDSTGGATDSGAANLFQGTFFPELQKIPAAIPGVYDLCRIIPASAGKAVIPKLEHGTGGGTFGSVACTWAASEGATKGETEPTFAQLEISTNELSAYTDVTIQALSRSAINLEAELMTLFRDALRWELNYRIMRGSGSTQPLGVIHSSSACTTLNRAVNNDVSWVDLVGMEFAIPMGIRSRGTFICDDTVEKALKWALDGQQRPLFARNPGTGKVELNGYTYTSHEYGPDMGTKGDIVFGDFQQYGVALESDVAIARSEHAEFKKGLITYRVMCLVGGKVIHPTAFVVLDVAA